MLERDLNSEKKTNARWNIFFMLAIICTINYIDRAVISVCMPTDNRRISFFTGDCRSNTKCIFLGLCINANSLWLAL